VTFMSRLVLVDKAYLFCGGVVGLSGTSAIMNAATLEVDEPSSLLVLSWKRYCLPVFAARNKISCEVRLGFPLIIAGSTSVVMRPPDPSSR